MTETAAFLDSLFVRQRETLRQRLVLMLTPADPDRGRLDPLADALAEHVRVGWLERGALGLDRPRADAWRSLIRAGQIYYGARIPALGETARLGAMTAKHLKALGRLRFVPPALARPLAGLGRLPMPGLRGRRAALAALATYGGDPALLPYLRRETFTALRDQTLARLTREAGPAESLGPDADPLLVVALLRPDDPAFADLTLACQRQWVPLLAIQTDDGDLLARGPLFHVPRFVAVLGSVDDADVRLAGVSEDRVVRPAEALLDGSQTGALFADRIRPPAEKNRLTRANSRRLSISHAYGADVIVQRYCGLPEPPAIPAYWEHGWLPSAFADQPMLIAKHKVMGQGVGPDAIARIEAEKRTAAQWVARADEAEVLTCHGYTHVDVVGLPFCYLPETGATREPGSLLVMPPHGLAPGPEQTAIEDRYAAYIKGIAPHFSRVLILVAPGDHWRGVWSPAFEAHGFEVLLGVDHGVSDALIRLKTIFQSIEFLTTSGSGSHVPYAASCGVKVSFAGPMRAADRAVFESSFSWRLFPETHATHMKVYDPDALCRAYPFLFTDPWLATDQTAWGEAEIGMPNRLSPEGLRALIEKRGRDSGFLPSSAR